MIEEMLLTVLDKAKNEYREKDAPLVRQVVNELIVGVKTGKTFVANGVMGRKVVLEESSPILKSVYAHPLDELGDILRRLRLPNLVYAAAYFHGNKYAVDIGIHVWGLLNKGATNER